ncbi:hypothetical protein E3Q13_03906 [Wallemia mellicola]|nr:hypothetical protein E3Q13_03906 [Wallemia mellicola]
MNRSHFLNDRLIYIPNFITQSEENSLIDILENRITERQWRYDGGYKHQFIVISGGQLTKAGKLIQSSTPDHINSIYTRIQDYTSVLPNYSELYVIQPGQGHSGSVKATTATLTLSTHLVVQTELANTPILLEPRSLLIAVDNGPPNVIPGAVDRVTSPPASLLNAEHLTKDKYKRFAISGGQLPRSEGYILTMYDIKSITKSFINVLK